MASMEKISHRRTLCAIRNNKEIEHYLVGNVTCIICDYDWCFFHEMLSDTLSEKELVELECPNCGYITNDWDEDEAGIYSRDEIIETFQKTLKRKSKR
jgi:hypothetical protein